MKATESRNILAELTVEGFYLHGYSNGAHAKANVDYEDDGVNFKANLNGKLIAGILSGMPGNTDVHIKKVTRGIEFKFGGAKLILDEVQELDLEDFENVVATPEVVASIKASDFSDALKSVVTFASKDDTRFYLRGVFMTSVEGKMVLVATDGFRMAENKTSFDLRDDSEGVIIPREFAHGMADILDGDSTVQILMMKSDPLDGINVRRVIFKTDNFELNSPVICGKFPNYSAVIPTEDQVMFSLNTDQKQFLNAIERIALVSGAYVRLSFNENGVIVQSPDGESSELSAGMNCNGKTHEQGYTARYLASAINATDSGVIKLFSQPGKLLLKNERQGWQAVVMGAKV